MEEAASGILAYRQGALLAQVDIQSAYRNIPIHPDDRWLLGMIWDNAPYLDTALPFGLRSAPKIFTAVADAVEWIARQHGVKFIIHYLDDYLIIGAPNSDGRFLTRSRFVSHLKEALIAAGVDTSKYSGHSFRIGAATTAASCGIQDSLIKTLGRWESDAYTLYIRTPRETLCEVSQSLARLVHD